MPPMIRNRNQNRIFIFDAVNHKSYVNPSYFYIRFSLFSHISEITSPGFNISLSVRFQCICTMILPDSLVPLFPQSHHKDLYQPKILCNRILCKIGKSLNFYLSTSDAPCPPRSPFRPTPSSNKKRYGF